VRWRRPSGGLSVNRSAPADTRPVGVAVVGFGNAGRQHLAAIEAVDGARLAAMVEIDAEGARRASAAGLPVRTLPEALADPSVELLALCVPPGDRPPVTAAALAAGKHLLVEKLPARSAAELDELLRGVARAGLLAGVMFQHRFALPEPLRVGAPERFARAVASLLVSRPRPATHFRAGDWRSRPETAVGGVTAHLGVHYLDLACQLLGEPTAIRPLARTDAVAGIDVQLCGHVSFRLGAELAVTVTSRAAARHEQLTVLGERDWVELRSGATTGELDGRSLAVPGRPVPELRAAVYRELVGAVRGGLALDLAALSRSAGVAAVIDGLLGIPVAAGSGVA
jgi:UDP-N-acetyl-2-amino-2-deoxyglucuronate dehydrogenase